MTAPLSGLPTTQSGQVQVEAPQAQLVLPIRYIGKIPKLDATPSVLNCERWQCQNTAPTTIINFDEGAQGQELKLLGDGETTIANNTTIKTNTGAAKLLLVNKLYTFVLFGTVWIEHS